MQRGRWVYLALGASLVSFATLGGCRLLDRLPGAQDAKCQSFGAIPGTDAYIQCRQALYQQQMMADANRRAIIAGAVISSTQPPPMQPAPLPTVCRTVPNGYGYRTICN